MPKQPTPARLTSRFILLLLLIGASLGAVQLAAQGEAPPADIVNDEGGAVVITGEVTYTNTLFTAGVAQPIIITEDQAGFVDRNEYFIMPPESQTLAQITSDFYTSPFTYSLTLPIQPRGSYRDVDHDDAEETGVQVFAIAYWSNTFGDPFLEVRDLSGGGWSGAYASTRIDPNPSANGEVIGGTYVIYAPDDQQGFPSGFGADGRLFTEDDPIVTVPQGYTVVNLDSEPFTFDRSAYPVIDLIEGERAALSDFSRMSYPEAFDAMIELFSTEYAFTEWKNLDWDALQKAWRPRFEQAQANNDVLEYRRALRDFLWTIPDGHVSAPFIQEDFVTAVIGGIGMAIRELDDGRVLVTYVTPGAEADAEGIEVGAEILSIQGMPVKDWVDQTIPWTGPFSTDHARRLDQLRFATRFELGTRVEVEYINPDSAESETVRLLAEQELDSLFVGQETNLTGFELPVEYRLLPSGYGYAQIYSFSDNDLLTIQVWERMIQTLIAQEIPGLIIDMRVNGGGSGFLADSMAAYFFDEELELGSTGFYDASLGDFYFDPRGVRHFYLPPDNLRYFGEIAVIVSPSCLSACEFFSYDMTLEDRAAIVGHYPTGGLGGSVQDFQMPEGETIRFTIGRAVNSAGDIFIEGLGVAPTVRVPVTEETLLGGSDALLDAAVEYLDEQVRN
ncbi:MAG: PDZ domain-containing protein [Anaerolinea sp.]|nr:PDZ domain-containing protein [Anaerolinea sp.]